VGDGVGVGVGVCKTLAGGGAVVAGGGAGVGEAEGLPCAAARAGKASTAKKAAQQINEDRSVWRKARSLDINSPLALDSRNVRVAETAATDVFNRRRV
jgi:hypothetical protein